MVSPPVTATVAGETPEMVGVLSALTVLLDMRGIALLDSASIATTTQNRRVKWLIQIPSNYFAVRIGVFVGGICVYMSFCRISVVCSGGGLFTVESVQVGLGGSIAAVVGQNILIGLLGFGIVTVCFIRETEEQL